MMRPIKDIEEIAKPNTDCNIDLRDLIKKANNSKDERPGQSARNLIDILSGKPESALRMDENNEYVVADEWKKESELKNTKRKEKEMER